ncbi:MULTISPECIES: 50S ribosomal protein L25/general stress protein Ctc [unclassified Aureimonas]|uniref:50S ribosomal protein L25/general stress protein Ctc n=1 Tax=unclassified Aureimonas TaxID=2615206 RepID=UPI0006FC3808|nr:50S ribosomal protein L25/general stress protein Ctc [Aureimonas sp. Leaf427]KQT66130.1 50S ribosomal protein L25 [Aureimonas sp. Leaf427]KQT81006.1 50S ribosomal protein L25 [Aureimonas sp. Leaf460]
MSETYTVKAEAREKVGKGAARHLRRNGLVPAVIYGDKQEPLPITIPYKETFLKLHAGGFKTTIATIELNGQKIKVLPKDYQLDPVKDFLIHVDFLRVSSRTVVQVAIPVHFENEDAAPGIKAQDGVLNIAHHSVEVECPAESIPEAFTVDLTGLEIGAAIHASELKLPKGVSLALEGDTVIATIVPPMAEEVDEVVEAPETEVTGQGPEAEAASDDK